MSDTRYVQITEYCLIEYIFAEKVQNPSKIVASDLKVVRNSEDDYNLCFYPDTDDLTVRNIQDVTALPIGGGKFVKYDSDVQPGYVQYDDDFTEKTVPNPNFPYDAVRFHFMSGFSFKEFDGLLLTISHRQNNGLLNEFASTLVNPSTVDRLLYFNPKPFFLTDAFYDRYVELKVPSIYHLNDVYYGLPQNLRGSTLAAELTPDAGGGYSGFVEDAPVRVGLHECDRKDDIINKEDERVRYELWSSQLYKESSIPQKSKFGNLGLVIREADDGDYLEYYATESGQFIEDFIGRLQNANTNDDWNVIHQLSVFEQTGSSFVNTKNMMDIQERDFDEPLTFRPVLKFADTAVSFSVDYTYRLVNRRTGEQHIKKGSYTSNDVKKYGKKTNTIPLSGKPLSNKIYNRIFNTTKDATRLFVEPSDNEAVGESSGSGVVERNVYVPVFFNMSRVTASSRNTRLQVGGDDEVVFANGEMLILLTPFDNFFKFKFYDNVDGKTSELDLAGLEAEGYSLYFKTGDDSRVGVDYDDGLTGSKLKSGEVVFKVTSEMSKDVLASDYRNFYVTSNGSDGTVSVMYHGTWRNENEVDEIKKARQEVLDELDAQYEAETGQSDEGEVAETNAPGVLKQGAQRQNQASAAFTYKKPPEDGA